MTLKVNNSNYSENTTNVAGSVVAYIGIGSNLDTPEKQVRNAITSLQNLRNSSFLAVSSWYQSKAVGPGDQADYINGVAKLQTHLSAIELLDALQDIETRQLRKREIRWGPRTIDLDILLYGEYTIDHDRLYVPHRHIFERNFVMLPLAELDPNLCIPHHKSQAIRYKISVSEHCDRLGRKGIIKL